MQTRRRKLIQQLAAIALVSAACSRDGGPVGPGGSPSISITVQPAAVQVQAGQVATVSVSVSRAGGFSGPVTLEVTGLPAGVSASFSPATLNGATASSTLTFTASANVAAGSANTTVRATGTGVTAATAALSLSVTSPGPQPAYTLTLDPATLTIVRGASGSAQVRITRTAFTGSVALVASGAPAGVGVTISPNPTTADVATLTLTAAGAAAAGNYTVTITGQAQGMADRTATLALTVTTPPSGGAVVWNFCASNAPVWLAYQNDTGPWTRLDVTAGSALPIPITARGGVAFVTRTTTALGELYHLVVFYGTAAQLRVHGEDWCASYGGGKQVSGTLANAPGGAFVSLGLGAANPPAGTTTFTLTGVPDGPRDLVAARVNGAQQVADRLIIRRDVDAADGATLPVLDFAGGEAFNPVSSTVSVTNGGGVPFNVGVVYTTANRTTGFVSGGHITAGTNAYAYYAVPPSQQQPGDMHALSISGQSGTAVRGAALHFHAPGNRTVTLSPQFLAFPGVSVAAPTPYPRFRLQLQSQAEYGKQISIQLNQLAQPGGGLRLVTASITAAYLGGTPATWDFQVPDLTPAGFDANWAPRTGVQTTWSVFGYGHEGDMGLLQPYDGLVVLYSIRAGITTP